MSSTPPRLIAPARVRHTLHTLVFASLVLGAMLVVRFIVAGNFRFSGLFGNLLLAWIPILFAFHIRRLPAGSARGWFWGAWVLWVLFFPNAFYIITDLIHLKKFGLDGIYRWYDMLITAASAFGGAFLGCLSLYLMQLYVRERFGWRKGWVFAAGMLALGSFGIYMGRFLRLNSWDVFTRPAKLTGKLAELLVPARAGEALAFSVTFFFLSLAIYAFVVSFGRLHEPADVPPPVPRN